MSDTTRKGRRRGSSAAPAFSGLATDECGPDDPIPYSVVSRSAPPLATLLAPPTPERPVDAGVGGWANVEAQALDELVQSWQQDANEVEGQMALPYEGADVWPVTGNFDEMLRAWATNNANWTEAEIYPAAGALYDKALRLLCEKFNDYGRGNILDAPGGALNGVVVRMWDKMSRVRHLLETGAAPQNESLRDSFLDLMNYAAIAQMLLDESWPGQQ